MSNDLSVDLGFGCPSQEVGQEFLWTRSIYYDLELVTLIIIRSSVVTGPNGKSVTLFLIVKEEISKTVTKKISKTIVKEVVHDPLL